MTSITEAGVEHEGHHLTTDDDDADLAVAGSSLFSERPRNLGLWLAPVGIALLGVLLYRYYQGLDLANATIQQRSALDWDDNLVPQIQEHLSIAFWSTVIVILVAVPLGVALTRPRLRRAAPFVLAIANSGQAVPAYGLLILFLAWLGQGPRTVIWALVLYAILPVLRNTMVGLDNVDRSIIEAGRGMGMTKTQALLRIELPLAVPVIIAGVRVAMIINIGMATLAYLIGGGGLGITIAVG
ncbi:MAG: ABC transporter permease, partial [Acidimicrobiales bacterium]|nr:ABC transporter permease [Acidimicrobiales bacterium]